MNLTSFAGQNWLITPAAVAVGEQPPASIHEQKWLLVLTGVVVANLQANSTDWLTANLSFLPDMAGPSDSGPLNWAIDQYAIQKPAGQDYTIGFAVDEWAPFVSLSAIDQQAQSTDAAYAVYVWRPNHFAIGIDAFSDAQVGNIFAGVNVDVGVRGTNADILRLGYNITLRGQIVFTKTPVILFESNFETTTANQPPSAVQAVGTAAFNGPNVVVSPTFPHTGNWLQIGPKSQAGARFSGVFVTVPTAPNNVGLYTFSAMMFMSSTSAESYISFNSSAETNPSFLGLLFADNNQVQDAGLRPTGCTFPRDQPFAIEVILTVTATSATAQIGVAGTVATQTVQYPSSFSSVEFGQENFGGSGFDVTDIVVTYTPQ
jgi:hypothetical protein